MPNKHDYKESSCFDIAVDNLKWIYFVKWQSLQANIYIDRKERISYYTKIKYTKIYITSPKYLKVIN